jgi:curved DNA-binding protein CbpA
VTGERDPYDVLGVPAAATAEQIASAYRRLARRYHPDVSAISDAEQRMAEVNAAWTLLRDPVKRAAWDESQGVMPANASRYGRPASGRTGAQGTTGVPWPSPGTGPRPAQWRRGPDGEGAAGPPPGNPRGSVLPFGRHIGWSLGEIARVDPGYLVWLEGRREGAAYRDEIEGLLAAIRPKVAETTPDRRRRGPFG